MAKKEPSSNGKHGRNTKGQFTKGHIYSKGNLGSTNQPARELKKALLEAVNEGDIKAIGTKLIEKAIAGEIPAIKELFDRLWGRAPQAIAHEHDITDDLAKLLLIISGRDDLIPEADDS